MAEGLLLRRRLLDLLSTGPRLRVLTAPSGFGKTTLLRTWVDGLAPGGKAVIWVPLSEDLRSRIDFWVLAAASAIRTELLDPAVFRALLRRSGQLRDPLSLLIKAFERNGPTVLLIDAYERLRDGIGGEVSDQLLRLVSSVPDLEVVVSTRAATRLSDDVHVLRGLVRRIDESQLRFTEHEVEELLQVHAPHALAAAARIAADTHGYPLGVRAAVYTLERLSTVPAYDSSAWQRLVSADLRAQIANPAIAEFVLDTSVPPYFDRELAAELAGTDPVDAGADAAVDDLLEQGAWNGLGRWIPYATGRQVFQYVESVRDVFLGELQAERPERYRRAAGISAAWLHRHGEHAPALGLAIDAQQLDLASSIVRSMVVSNPEVYLGDQFERQLRRVPRAALPGYPVLAVIRGLIVGANPATVDAAADFFRIVAAHGLDDIDRLATRDVLYSYVGREVALRKLGRFAEASESARQALAYLDAMSASDREGLGEFVTNAQFVSAYSLFEVGDLDGAFTAVQKAVAAAVDPWWQNYALAFAAGMYALAGRGVEARATLAAVDQQNPLAGRGAMPTLLGVTGAAVMLLDEFQFEAASHAYDGGPPLQTAETWPRITWVLAHARLGLGEAAVEAERIKTALLSKPRPPAIGATTGTAALRNVLAILLLISGNAVEARRILRAPTPFPGQLTPGRLLDELLTGDPAQVVRRLPDLHAEPGHTIRSLAAIDTLGAAAALRAGNERTALRLLERAATQYRTHGVRVQLLYVPDADLVRLRELADTPEGRAGAEYLDVAHRSFETVASPPVVLSRREAEVLAAWAKHRTRAELAAALVVSENTVRSQLSSAYRKLGVTTKDAAIQRAIELDLLPSDPARRMGDG